MRLKPVPLLLLLATGAPALADDVLQQAESLLAGKKAADAVALLAPLEEERAGDPAFDYLMGLSHLENGDPSQSVFAFERCLAVEPNNGPCRVQIARAHLAVGETANARAELETIRQSNPPAQVETLVAQYLGAVDAREKRQKRQLDGQIRFGLGFDSNANSATDLKQVALPDFNNALFDVTAASRKQDSIMLQGQFAGSYLNRLSPTLTALADAGLQVRSYPDSSDYSYTVLDAGAGAALTRGRQQFIGKLQLQTMQLGGDPYRNLTGLLGQYQYDLAGGARLAAWLQLGQLRYEQSARDSNRTTLGGAWSQGLEMRWSPVVFGSLYTGQERAQDASVSSVSQDFHGLRAGGSLTLDKGMKLNSALSFEQRQYKGVFQNFGKSRDDNELSLNLGLEWKIAPAVSLLPSLTVTQNDSSITLTDYDRQMVSLEIRYDL